jgi:AcrR family transcriptional regulator
MKAARQDGEARREAILDAALACFEERGLVRTGIEDIRKAAGASPSSVYHLFAGLPELIAALLERTFVRRYTEESPPVLRAKTARGAVIALVEAHLRWVFGHPTEARFMYRTLALGIDEGHREALRTTKEQLKAALGAHLRKLHVIADDPGAEGMIDMVLLGLTHQACRTWLTTPDLVDPKWMKRMLPELAWQSVRVVNAHRLRRAPIGKARSSRSRG